jgi:hypothetical protein
MARVVPLVQHRRDHTRDRITTSHHGLGPSRQSHDPSLANRPDRRCRTCHERCRPGRRCETIDSGPVSGRILPDQAPVTTVQATPTERPGASGASNLGFVAIGSGVATLALISFGGNAGF